MKIRRDEAAKSGLHFNPLWRPVPLQAVSSNVVDAVVEHVDPNFFHHHGLDWGKIAHAWRTNRQLGHRAAGGSSITCQLAKNLWFSPRKTYLRKALELPAALWMELSWGKSRILETYLNMAEWGDGIFGIEAAAQSFFEIPAAEVNLRQACALSAVLPNPRIWSPACPSYYTLTLAELIRRRVLARKK